MLTCSDGVIMLLVSKCKCELFEIMRYLVVYQFEDNF